MEGNHQIAQLVNIYCKTGNLYFAFHLGFEVNIQDIITTFITNVFIASAPKNVFPVALVCQQT